MALKPVPVALLRDPRHFLALGFGAGLSPFAPGTFGTMVAILPYLLFSQLTLLLFIVVLVVAFVLGIYLCDYTSRALDSHDHAAIVWDEFVGFWVSMIALPVVNWQWILTGFVCFRFFDIFKPWPINLADLRIPGGLGVMTDDLLAGLYALGCLQALDYIL